MNFGKSPGIPAIRYGDSFGRPKIRTSSLGRFQEWKFPFRGDPSEDEAVVLSFDEGTGVELPVRRIQSFGPDSRVLVAIQKNNRIRWIQDWFQYYRNRFEVSHLVLYDNGSSDLGSLTSAFPGDSTVIVKWDFPYGPPTSHSNKFSQIGALNHCRRTFSRNSIMFNFDIDELLVDPTGIVRQDISKYNTLYFSSFLVPHIDNLPEDYSFSDYRRRFDRPTRHAGKYICKSSSARGVSAHYVEESGIRFVSYGRLLLRRLLNYLIRYPYKRRSKFSRPVELLLRKISHRKVKSYSTEEAYFLHFLGITTNWKPGRKRLKDLSHMAKVDDPALAEMEGHQ